MAANFDKVFGFYVGMGSIDYPLSWSPSLKFGFNKVGNSVDYTKPVFDASLSSTQGMFFNPIITSIPLTYTPSVPGAPVISHFIVERPVDDFENGDITGIVAWKNCLKIVEYCYFNQVNVTLVSFEAAISNYIGVDNNHYVKDSIHITRSSKDTNRVESIRFELNFDTIDPNDKVIYTIYFDPDVLIESRANEKHAVYFYEDKDFPYDDGYINFDEWKDRISKQHLSIFNDGRYTVYNQLQTKYVYSPNIPGKTTATHQFIVYGVKTLSPIVIRNAVKNFLRTTIRPHLNRAYTYSELVYHYPELFGESTINVYPVNNVSIGDPTKRTLPLRFDRFKSILVSKNADEGNANFKNAEVIYIGNHDLNGANNVSFPIICVDNKSGETLTPITSRYPNYIPIFSSFNSLTDYDNATIPIETKFHRLMYRCMVIMLNGIDPDINVPQDYQINIQKSVSNVVVYCDFIHNGTTFIVHNFV